MDYQELDEGILTLTGTKEWKSLIVIVSAEHQAALQNELEAKDWDTVNYQRGYREALRFVADIREHTKALIEQANA